MKVCTGKYAAKTIRTNCDHWLFFGSPDYGTSAEIALRFNVQPSTVLNMQLNEAYLIARGGKSQKVEKYDLEEDVVYKRLMSPYLSKHNG